MVQISSYFQLIRAGWILAREGVLSALPRESLDGPLATCHHIARILARRKTKKQHRSENMSHAINKLGPSYIKLGQFLATRPDIVGHDIATDLAQLQDRVQTFPCTAAIAQIESSLGRPMNDLFINFCPPIAAASVAQVHPAEYYDEAGHKKNALLKLSALILELVLPKILKVSILLPVYKSVIFLLLAVYALFALLKLWHKLPVLKWTYA